MMCLPLVQATADVEAFPGTAGAARTMAQASPRQFFTGATGGERFIIDVGEAARAAASQTAGVQRAAAPAVLAGWRAALYAERSTDRFARDARLALGPAWERWTELWEEN